MARCQLELEYLTIFIIHLVTRGIDDDGGGRGVSREPQYKDVYRRTKETPQRALIFKANCCLKVHNAH